MTEQLDADGRLRHLLAIDGLPRAAIERLLDRAQQLAADARGGTALRNALAGTAVCTLFFEPSTRTRSSFLLAAQRGSAPIPWRSTFPASSTSKGETALDTLRNIEAMGVRGFVVRHREDGAVAALAAAAAPGTALVNAGDGRSHHPTQGLLDMLTLRQAKGTDFSGLKVLIVGDVKHSRVARSDLRALRTLGTGEIRVFGPASLLPDDATLADCVVPDDFDSALDGVDAVMMLRLQRERMEEGLVPSLEEYHRDYGLTEERLRRAAPDAVVLHPGPMNRGVEIDDAVADGAVAGPAPGRERRRGADGGAGGSAGSKRAGLRLSRRARPAARKPSRASSQASAPIHQRPSRRTNCICLAPRVRNAFHPAPRIFVQAAPAGDVAVDPRARIGFPFAETDEPALHQQRAALFDEYFERLHLFLPGNRLADHATGKEHPRASRRGRERGRRGCRTRRTCAPRAHRWRRARRSRPLLREQPRPQFRRLRIRRIPGVVVRVREFG